jgi:hypothetical protein
MALTEDLAAVAAEGEVVPDPTTADLVTFLQ